jgi:hypothetical protein
VAGESAVRGEAVAGHLLIQAAIASSGFAENAFATGHDRRDNDLFSDPGLIPGHHDSRDLVPQGERRFGDRGNSVIKITEVRVADPATRDFDKDLSGLELRDWNLLLLELARYRFFGFLVEGRGLNHLPCPYHVHYSCHVVLLCDSKVNRFIESALIQKCSLVRSAFLDLSQIIPYPPSTARSWPVM